MGFLSTLTEQEQAELQVLATDNKLVAKLCNELKIYESDVTKEFFSALKKGVANLTRDIHSETLDLDQPYTKSIIKLAESGSKIFDSLKRGTDDTGGEKLKDETKDNTDNTSIVDRAADKSKKNL